MEATATKAQTFSRAFETRKRDNGDEYTCLREGSPDWMRDLCHEAHGDMFPDDWRYKLIERVADIIADSEGDEDEARQAMDDAVDVYTGQLTDWLASHVERQGYCDEAMEERGEGFVSTFCLLQLGQMQEMEEIFGVLWQALIEESDDDDDSEEN